MILGIDPGATTGWCLYDPTAKRVVDANQFRGHACDIPADVFCVANRIVVERPEAHGATRPQVVECAYTTGRLVGWLEVEWFRESGCLLVHEMTRREVCKILTDAASLDTRDRVKNDSTAWSVLKLLHGGEGSDKKPRVKKGEVVAPGGPIGGVKSHERAALAVAVAFAVREGVFAC